VRVRTTGITNILKSVVLEEANEEPVAEERRHKI